MLKFELWQVVEAIAKLSQMIAAILSAILAWLKLRALVKIKRQ